MENKGSSKSKVIIVGSGAAGLGAAQFLVKNGVTDIVILEANNRIGGRVNTVQFGPFAINIIELGANWIHGGTIANPLFTLAVQHGFTDSDGSMPILERFERCAFGKSNGVIVDLQLSQRAVESFFRVERAAFMLFYQSTPSIGEDETLQDYMLRELDLKLKTFAPEERHDVQCIFNALLNYLRFHVSDDLDKLSLKQYGTFQEIPGGDVIIPSGILNLLRAIADELPPNCIHFNQEVTQIAWNDQDSEGRRITLLCNDGSRWQANHVILTVSLGHLKKHHHTLFNPPLPRPKADAIRKIGFGCTNKIFLEFQHPFWKSGMLGYLGLAWENKELRTATGDSWEKYIYGFEEVYGNPNVLAAWIAGRGSEIMETVPDTIIVDTCTKLLRRCTGNETIPRPCRVIRTTWRMDRFSLGSYSYATTSSGLPEIEILSQPLPSSSQPALLFAGEATHPRYYSTVHGAFLSGIREAERILRANAIAKL